ncbi:hypothetical protein K9M79_00545 [Candidatus Woesearchaeota archaeon]|nr:hypothetical protein [Candidatus Woesearchaeota archaeon]
MNIRCVRCKGRGECGRKSCAHAVRMKSRKKLKPKQHYFGETPNIFVGRYGYPNISLGLLSIEEYDMHDDPVAWYNNKYSIQSISDLRTELVNSSLKTNINVVRKNPQHTKISQSDPTSIDIFSNNSAKYSRNDLVNADSTRLLEISQEVAMASKPVDVEISLKKVPQFSIDFSDQITPFGPSVELHKASLTENAKIPSHVEKVYSDDEQKTGQAIEYLCKHNYDEHYITKIMSSGSLGLKTDRKLVPSRWAITATDDSISKLQITKIKNFNQHEVAAYFGGHLGNYYLILTFPDIFRYELFETYVPSNGNTFKPMTDYENHLGRTSYAKETAGGYYAARLALTEALLRIKKQASCLVLRFITDEYTNPLGVWVVRQASRDAMSNKPITFSDADLMIKYTKALVQKKFGYDIAEILSRSKLYNEVHKQLKLGCF